MGTAPVVTRAPEGKERMQPEIIGDRYRVLSPIGQGGMGTVWLCRDERLARDVAVKQVGLLPGESVTDSARAFREARSSAGLNHRHVVTVYDVVEESGHIWLVMEHVPGRSLSEIIKQDGRLDPAVVARIGAQVADGLATAHAAGITHRDVKPGNILVREDGTALISDFGLARKHADPALTLSGSLTGTPSYFSPELARGGDPSPGDDVWALGATLYAGVEGRPPYEAGPNPVAILHQIVSAEPAAPVHAGFLGPAVRRMMDRDPRSRWAMADAARVLGRLAAEHPVSEGTLEQTRPAVSRAPTPPVAAPEPEVKTGRPAVARPSPRPRRRPGLVLVGVLALLLLAAVVGVLALLDPGSGDRPSSAGSSSHSPSPRTSRSPATSSSSAPPSTGGGGSAGARMERFVRRYYAVAPGGTDQAWSMLGPGEQAQGRDSYDRFWRTIRSVDVTSARAAPGSDVVDVTLVYRTTDGRTSTERKREGLVQAPGGGYRLNSDVPAR